MTLHFYVVQADHGDCFFIKIDGTQDTFTILIDGGPQSTYKRIKRTLETLQVNRLNLVVITHVDADHIDGVKKLFDNLKALNLTIDNVWLNAFEAKLLVKPGTLGLNELRKPRSLKHRLMSILPFMKSTPSFSIETGISLCDKIDAAILNKGFEPVDIAKKKWRMVHVPWSMPDGSIKRWDIDPWQLHVIGPTVGNLEGFLKDWQELDKTPEFANRSSIMIFLENPGEKKRLLLPGDGYAWDIEQGLNLANLVKKPITINNPLPVTLLKVPHHGSTANIIDRGRYSEFFQKFPADTVIISAKWLQNQKNPDFETLTHIADATSARYTSDKRTTRIFATNSTPSLKQIVTEKTPEACHYKLDIMTKGKDFEEIKV